MLSIHIKNAPATPEVKAAALRCYCAAIVCLLIVSEVFSSNIQSTLPQFSTICRAVFTGGALLLLLYKILFLTDYENPKQYCLIAAIAAYAGFAALYGDDKWFFLAALVGLGCKDIPLRPVLRVYLATAAAGLVLVQLLHLPGLVPFNWYCRNWDFGFGHYNGYGARLLGIFFAWGWLRLPRPKWYDWAGLSALLCYTWFIPHCRGACGGMAALLGLFVMYHIPFVRRIFTTKIWAGALLALAPIVTLLSMVGGYVFVPSRRPETPVLTLIDKVLSGRLEIWHNVFWQTPVSLLGGVATDGDEHHAVDNVFLAVWMNKGLLGGVLVFAGLLLLLWRLLRRGCVCETLCLCAMMLYWVMENKPFLLSANPLLLLLPCLFFYSAEAPLPTLYPPHTDT